MPTQLGRGIWSAAPRQRQAFLKGVRRRWHCLALCDIPELFAIDEKYGLVRLGGRYYKPRVGFQIGGQAAAGGANLYAADKEEEGEHKYGVGKRDTRSFFKSWKLPKISRRGGGARGSKSEEYHR